MELFDFGIPALDKALNLTATVLLLLALGMLLIRVILRLCDRAFDRSERLAPFHTYLLDRCGDHLVRRPVERCRSRRVALAAKYALQRCRRRHAAHLQALHRWRLRLL